MYPVGGELAVGRMKLRAEVVFGVCSTQRGIGEESSKGQLSSALRSERKGIRRQWSQGFHTGQDVPEDHIG